MKCPKCGYLMDAFDNECPRCHGKGLPGVTSPAPAPQAAQPPGQSDRADVMAAQVQQLAPGASKSGGASKPSGAFDQKPAQSYQVGNVEVDDDPDSWWHSIGYGLLCWGVAAYSYWHFAYAEAHGGFIRERWWVLILYNIGGKWLVAGVFGLLGLLLVVLGIAAYPKGDKK